MYNNNGIKFKRYIALFIAFIIIFSSFNISTLAAVSSTEHTITFTSNDTDRFQKLFDSNMFFNGAIEGSEKEVGKYTYPILYKRNFLTTQLRYDAEELGLSSIQIICGEADKTISVAEFPSSPTYLEGVGKPGSEGIRYWNTGTALQVQVFKWTPTDNITIKYNFAVDESEFSIKGVFSSDESKGTVREASFGANENEFILSATPNPGYMLDYWEWTDTEGDWENTTKIPNDIENSKVNITETITEDRWYRAVFKEWQFIMPGGAAIVNLSETMLENWSYLEDLKGRVSWLGNPMPLTESIRAGKPAILHLLFNFPSTVNLGSGEAKLSLFAGDATSDPTAEAFVDNWYIPGLKGLCTTKPLSKASLYVEALPNAKGITVEIKTADGSVATRKYYPLTIEMDSSAEYREEKLTKLKQYYIDNFAEEPLDKINPNTGHQDFERIETKREKYNSLSPVRYLLRYAYEDAVKTIKYEATDEDNIDEKYDEVIELFKEYITLNNKIKEGNGDKAYKDLKKANVKRVLVYHNSTDILPTFAYIPEDSVVRDALEASLESYSPGNWVINGGGFITGIGIGYGDGKVESGGNSSQIVYAQNHKWAIGVASQTMTDRDVINVGQTIVINSYPILEKLPDKTELLWAVGTLNEKIQAGKLKPREEFDNAVKIAKLWNVAFHDGKAVGVNSHTTGTELAKSQEAVDNALAKLQAAYPDDNLIRLDLPEEVLNVMKLINDIGNITPASKDKIEEARKAYDNLSNENKELVPNYETLKAAEEAYKLLEENNNEDYKEVLSSSLKNLKESYSKNPTTGSMGGEWSILGLARSGSLDSDIESKYLGQLNAALLEKGIDGIGQGKYTEYSRVTLALSSLGIDAENYTYAGKDYNFTSKLLEYDNVVKQGINGPIFALLALDSKPYMPGNTEIRDDYIDYILARQHNDGGWALRDDKNEPSDPDITAMVLQALANYRGRSKVDNAINKGLEALKSMQDKTHGGFYNGYGDYNSESISQVIVALTSLDIDPTSDDWTVENGKNPVTAQLTFYDDENSMFKHLLNNSSDMMATEQATYALVALDRFNTKDSTSLYDMSDAFNNEMPGEDMVNKAGLGDIISLAQRLKKDDYTEDSWNKLESKLEEAIKLRDNLEATEEEVNKAREELVEIIGELKVKEVGVNKSLLNSAIAIAEGLDENNYKDWRKVSEALEEIKQIQAEANQIDVDQKAKNLIGALNSLELAPDKELLKAVLDKSVGLKEDNYKKDSWDKYIKVREEAEKLEKENSDQKDQNKIDFTTQDLIKSIANLELKEGEEKTEIQEILESIKGDLNKEKYTEKSLENLEKAKTIKELENSLIELETKNELDYSVLELVVEQADELNKEDYTENYKKLEDDLSVKLKLEQKSYKDQLEIAEDISRILTAMQGLERSSKTEERNKVLLRDLIGYADSLQKSRYSDETWEKLLDKLDKAKDTYKDSKPNDNSIEKVEKELLQAIGNLENITSEVVVDKTELSKQIEEALKITNEGKGYTTISWKSFEAALNYAREILKNNDASQEEINNASRDLRNAIRGLTEDEDDGSGGELPNIPTGKHATISVTDPNAKSGQTRIYFPRTKLEIRQGETAYSLLQKTGLDLRVSTHPVYEGVYVEAINGFGEFDDGPLSGWMYKVNGKFPNYSASLYELEDGDIVEWVYTRDLGEDLGNNWEGNDDTQSNSKDKNIVDYDIDVKEDKAYITIKEESMKDTINNLENKDEPILIIPNMDKSIKSIEFITDKSTINEVVNRTNSSLIIDSHIGKVSIPKDALKSIISKSKSNKVSMIIEKLEENKELIKGNNEILETDSIYNIMFIDGDKDITNLIEDEILISIPYELLADQKQEDLKLWFLSKNDKLEEIDKDYDLKNKILSFKIKPKKTYVIGIRENYEDIDMNFDDINPNDWFYKYVKNLVEKGVLSGVSDRLFAPNDIMTRSMMVSIIHRLEDNEPSNAKNIFKDVEDNKWYTDSIIWANDKDIAKGYSSNEFGVNDKLTREQAASILCRYAQYKGYDIDYGEFLDDYKDKTEISSWALDSMNWANYNEIIIGRTNDSLAPKGFITRAEVATMITKFINFYE